MTTLNASSRPPLSWEEAMQTLEHLPRLTPAERVSEVEKLFHHPSPAIRQRTLQVAAAILPDDAIVSYLREEHDDVLRNAGLEALKLRGAKAFPLALKLLEDPDGDVVLQAVLVLDSLKDPRASENLRGVLRHSDPNVVVAAITAIGHLGDSRSVSDLLPFLEADTWLQMAAIQALSDLRPAAAIHPLSPLLSDMMVGPLAAEALARIGGTEAFAALANHWLSPGEESDPEMMSGLLAHVLEGLSATPVNDVSPALLELLSDGLTIGSGSMKANCARCLLVLGPTGLDAASLTTVSGELSAAVLPSALSRRSDLTATLLAAGGAQRMWGLALLATNPEGVSTKIVAAALEGLETPDEIDTALKAVASLDDVSLAPSLVDLFLRVSADLHPLFGAFFQKQSSAVLSELAKRGESGGATGLVIARLAGVTAAVTAASLENLDGKTRLRAVSELSSDAAVMRLLPWSSWMSAEPEVYGPLAADVAIKSSLHDIAPELRALFSRTPSLELVRSLGALGDRESVPLLSSQLGVISPLFDAVAIESIGRIGGPEARETLRRIVSGQNGERRQLAFRALSRCGIEDDCDLFLAHSSDPDWVIRLACVELFSRQSSPKTFSALAALAADPVAAVSQRASALLERV